MNRPDPDRAIDRARVEEQSLRRRLMESSQRPDVIKEISASFDPIVAATMTISPDMSANPMAQTVEQVCTSFDASPTVHVEGKPDLNAIVTPELWPLMQEVHRLTEGARECYQRLDWIEGELVYRNVPADCIWSARATGKRKNTPTVITELVERYRGEEEIWTRETWDISGPTPVFRIEAWDGTAHWVDATSEFYRPDAALHQGPYPYQDRDGPIFPYIVNHARVGNALWNWHRGAELAQGSLRAAALMTHWCDGFTDAAHPQRYGIDVEVQGARTKQVNGTRIASVPTDRKSILLFKQTAPGGGLGQFEAAMDPLPSFQALMLYMQQLAIFAGLSPADMQITSGQSGHAIYVSREGQRRAQKAQQPALRMADQQRLATAARLANAYGGAKLPTEPKAYGITYAELSKSLEEKRAELEEIKLRKERGLASDVDAIKVFEPHLTDEQAVDRLVDIARTQAMLDVARAQAVTDVAPPKPAAEEPSVDDAPDNSAPPQPEATL